MLWRCGSLVDCGETEMSKAIYDVACSQLAGPKAYRTYVYRYGANIHTFDACLDLDAVRQLQRILEEVHARGVMQGREDLGKELRTLIGVKDND